MTRHAIICAGRRPTVVSADASYLYQPQALVGNAEASMNSHIVNPIARIVNSHKKMYFAGLVAGAALLLGGGTGHGPRDNNCPARMQQAQQDFSQAMRRYGMNSSEAQHERDELQNVAESCGYARGGYGYNDGDRDDRGRNNGYYS